MPKKEDHLRQARHNEDFAKSFDLDTSPFRDWAITGYFYSAVHLVEAYLGLSSDHSSDHRARDSSIGRDVVLKQFYKEYSYLKDESTNARYLGFGSEGTEPLPAAEIRRLLIVRHDRLRDGILAEISRRSSSGL